jgi:hypothetical protein
LRTTCSEGITQYKTPAKKKIIKKIPLIPDGDPLGFMGKYCNDKKARCLLEKFFKMALPLLTRNSVR